MWERCAPKTDYLCNIERGKSNRVWLRWIYVPQLTENLNRGFCCMFFDDFLTSLLSLLRRLTENLIYGIGVARRNGNCHLKLKGKEESSERKETEESKTVGSWFFFKSQETLNYGDNYFLVSKDRLVALRWKDSRVVMLLSNFMDP